MPGTITQHNQTRDITTPVDPKPRSARPKAEPHGVGGRQNGGHDKACAHPTGLFRHCHGLLFILYSHFTSTFLHPFAPRALPRFLATMGALTPARLALRTQWKRNEHQPFSGQVSLVHSTHPSMHSVSNHLTRPVIPFVLPTQSDRLLTFHSYVPRLVKFSNRLRLLPEGSSLRPAEFVILQTACSPPVAPHLASRRRSYLRLPGAGISWERTCTSLCAPASRRTGSGFRPLPRKTGN
jgi:hypothetical protein